MFTVGMSVKDSSIRYVKQIKVRTGGFKYGDDHVELCRIEKHGPFLGFYTLGYSSEDDQLKPSKSVKVTKAVKSTPTKKKGRTSRSRASRSPLASAQIDFVTQMANKAFNFFNKK